MYNLMYGSDYMETFLLFIIYFVLFYVVFKIIFFFQSKRKIVKRSLYHMAEIEILKRHFKVDTAKYELKKLLNIVSLSNALIFSVVLVGTSFIENYLLRLIGMFVLLIPVIYFVYLGVSKILNKKGDKDNV